jgi:hypothetical protein
MTAVWRWGEPLNEGFSNEPQEGYIETQPDAGLPFRRERFTDISDIIQASFILTRSEKNSFESWYRREIKQGAISFDYYDCRIEETRTARIVGKPSFSSNSTYYTLSIILNLDPFIRTVEKVLSTEDGKLVTTEDGKLLVAEIKEQL